MYSHAYKDAILFVKIVQFINIIVLSVKEIEGKDFYHYQLHNAHADQELLIIHH